MSGIDSYPGVDIPALIALHSSAALSLYADDGHVRTLREIERDVILRAVGHYGGHMALAARRLGISRSTLYRKLDELR